MKPLIITCGLSGSGKTYNSKELQKKLDSYVIINLGSLRQELGITRYSRKDTPKLLAIAIERIEFNQSKNIGSILDANLKSVDLRQSFYDLARDLNIEVIIIEIVCSDKTAIRRMEKRVQINKAEDPKEDKIFAIQKKSWQDLSIDMEENSHVTFTQFNTENFVAEIIKKSEKSSPEFLQKIITILEKTETTIVNCKLPFQNPLPESQLAIEAVFRAGEAILEVYEKNDPEVKFKGKDDPLTQADLRSNEILNRALSKTNHLILSEEDIDDLSRLEETKLWIIDPLDGTKEFIKKNGEFSIMVALVDQGKPILGIVYQPTTNELFISQKGQGAYELKNEEGKKLWVKLCVTDLSNISEFMAIMSNSHLSNIDRNLLNSLSIQKFSQKGSSGLKVAEICRGKAEIYFNTSNKLKQWDSCAAYSLITESGGTITDVHGKEIHYNRKELNHKNGLLVTNGKAHKKIAHNLIQFISKSTNTK